MSNQFQSTAERYQQDKEKVALLRRDGLKWHQVFPISIRQTIFPSIFQKEH
ncbi:hypothetical protein N0O92_07000 [Alkalihalobacillus sp. MEB130]|uniref:hypothetical protein n=1 Tax=Alkalihalobacillus sp. MEB130 TaxID=2976704 RepID=UPI0028DE95A1|nr:hypothetical protein [Alkalihalobacillus sp. MEB130]MDT8859976.1 hypothetical protein [Alkalihalobacillus sp. MEB130]